MKGFWKEKKVFITGINGFVGANLAKSLANQGASYLNNGLSPKRMGNSHPVIVPYQKFKTKDGSIIIACGNDSQFKKLCNALGWNFHENKKYKTNKDRVINRQSLTSQIQERLSYEPKDDIISKLDKVEVPCGSINSVADALAEPQALHRKMVYEINGSSAIRSPILFDTLPLKYKDSPPKLGQHTEEIRENLSNKKFWKNKN